MEVNHISSIWKKTFWANKIKKLYLFSEVDPMRPTLSIVYTNEISKNQTRFDSRFIHFGTISVGSLPGVVDQVKKIHIWNQAFSSRKESTNKWHGPSSEGTGGQQERWRFTAKPWHKFMASPAMLCNARGDAMALAVPLSARRQSSSAAAMWPRSRLCSCTMPQKTWSVNNILVLWLTWRMYLWSIYD